MKEILIYIHIPFCKSKCYYCDFLSFPNIKNVDQYINAIIKEINLYNKKAKAVTVKSIYIGGGTPSYIDSKHISKIMESLYKNFNIKEDCSVTIELNPATFDKQKLIDYKTIGINRLSVGLQSTNDSILKTIGRAHTYEEFEKSYNLIRKVGFNDINLDLMFGLPNQTIKDFENSLDEVISKSPTHISTYSLKIEEGTPFYDLYNTKRIELPEEETEREMYYLAKQKLNDNGYIHYEISNFSKPGFESIQNVGYWECESYIGIGLGAHSYFEDTRYNNVTSIEDYIKILDEDKVPKVDEYKLDNEEKLKEEIILGLRLLKGINIANINTKYNIDFERKYYTVLEGLESKGLIERVGTKLRLTSKGLDFSNIVFVEFI